MLKFIFSSVSKAIDYFICDSYFADTDMRYKVRLLVGCTLSFMVGVVAFGPFYLTINALSKEAAVYYYVFSVPVIVLWMWLLRLTKQGKKYPFCANTVITSTAVVLFGGVLITGGPAKTEVLPLITVPVVLAFMMMGQRAGLIWAVLVAACNYILVALDYMGFEFVNVAPPEAVTQLRIFNWSYSFFTIIVLVMIYEVMTRRLTNERNAERERFRHMAMHDALTGLPNRKYFDEALQTSLALADRSNNAVAIALLDLNGFKPINDELGHEVGDIVLRAVSERMQESLRKSDKVARLGGDEFAFVLNNVRTHDDAAHVCEKILAAVAKPIEINDEGKRISVTGSLGVAIYPDDSRDENELRVFSDKAMYQSKRKGTGWCLYSELHK